MNRTAARNQMARVRRFAIGEKSGPRSNGCRTGVARIYGKPQVNVLTKEEVIEQRREAKKKNRQLAASKKKRIKELNAKLQEAKNAAKKKKRKKSKGSSGEM